MSTPIKMPQLIGKVLREGRGLSYTPKKITERVGGIAKELGYSNSYQIKMGGKPVKREIAVKILERMHQEKLISSAAKSPSGWVNAYVTDSKNNKSDPKIEEEKLRIKGFRDRALKRIKFLTSKNNKGVVVNEMPGIKKPLRGSLEEIKSKMIENREENTSERILSNVNSLNGRGGNRPNNKDNKTNNEEGPAMPLAI